MSCNAGRVLYRVFRALIFPVALFLLWGASSLPLYASSIYYYTRWSSYEEFDPKFVGPDNDSMPMLYGGQEQLCLELVLPTLTNFFDFLTQSGRTLLGYQPAYYDDQAATCTVQFTHQLGSNPVQNAYVSVGIGFAYCPDGTTASDLRWVVGGANTRELACSAPTTCAEFLQFGSPLSGYLKDPLFTPSAYCIKLNESDPLADWCRWTYQDRGAVKNSAGLISGHNVTLAPTDQMCPDIRGVLFVDHLEADRNDQTDVVGGDAQPSPVTDGGGADPTAPDPIAPAPGTDPETITDSSELLQEIVKHLQDLKDAAFNSEQQLDDVNSELNEQTDVLNKILQQLGNHEGAGKGASSPLDCDSGLNCTGDPIQCAILLETRRARCAAESGGDNDYSVARDAALHESEQAGHDLNNGSRELFFQELLNVDPRYSSSCPAPEVFMVYGHSLEIAYDRICEMAPMLRAFVVMCGYVTAAFIIFKAL